MLYDASVSSRSGFNLIIVFIPGALRGCTC
jgi:hypothetical protein